MRKWAFFTEAVIVDGAAVQKIMLYDKPQGGTFVFLYRGKNSQICCADEWYPCREDALEAWDPRPHSAWMTLGDPVPGCQEDAFEPIRVKGRAEGKPEWGSYEILRGGEWREYTEKE